MNEIQRMVLIENLIWYGSLAAPLAVAAWAVVAARRANTNRLQIGFTGAVAAFLLGSVGSFVAGETIVGAIMGSGDIPYYRIAEAWHRMWYPLGLGLLVGIALALFSLLPQKSAA